MPALFVRVLQIPNDPSFILQYHEQAVHPTVLFSIVLYNIAFFIEEGGNTQLPCVLPTLCWMYYTTSTYTQLTQVCNFLK